jgi:putative restriction endonuclease
VYIAVFQNPSAEINALSKDSSVESFFSKYNNQKIRIPDKFIPAQEFLEYHYQEIFKR